MFLIRDARAEDLAALFDAAGHLDSVNLPHDRERIERIIERSEKAFAGKVEVSRREFLFVLAEVSPSGERAVGASMIFAQHGSRRAPHVFFDVIEEERYSDTLDKHVRHTILRIGYSYQGLTEIGGLVLLPVYRGHAERLGTVLSYVRFLYMALHRDMFKEEVVSELMPPLEPDGTSLLWESLGRRFTGLTYQEADRLSRENKEFIRALFPQDPIYATLLPEKAQALVGKVGPKTQGVERMLRKIGFEYASRIDPFDGGPHFHARTDRITLVKATRRARVAAGDGGLESALVAREAAAPPFFRAVRADVRFDGDAVALPAAARAALGVSEGDEIAVLPL